jgi:A/G-specific adenine glycosylase
MKAFFTKNLLAWNGHHNTRQMPWKGEKDPYKIWLSEIILQQTRVQQGLSYYQQFVNTFPTIQDLASAPEQKVFKLWEGLGYYTRCKNLITTAKFIVEEYAGIFPNKYNEILKLKGVGPYTAAAIASFAFQLPHAVVDGNVFRVLARYFGICTPIDTTLGKHFFTHLANELLDKKNPSTYNQAIMDFGALMCKPDAPQCIHCPLAKKCIAFKTDAISAWPVKEKKLVKKNRYFYYIVVQHQKEVLIRKRTQKDIWQNLHEFVVYESSKPLQMTQKKGLALAQQICKCNNIELKNISASYQQQLTHQHILAHFIEVLVTGNKDEINLEDYKWIKVNALKKYAFPRLINHFLTPIQQ